MNRILFLIKGLGRGGAEQLLLNAAPHVDRSRFEYEFAYLLPWKDALVGVLDDMGFPVHGLDGGRGIGWIGRLRRIVRDRDIDLMHSHSPVPAVGARVGVERRVRHVYTEHGVWGHYHRATFWANAATFPRNDHVFSVSETVTSSIRYPMPLGFLRMPPVETLYHGIDPGTAAEWGSSDGVREELGIPEDAPVVGTVANFRALKGHEYLLQAAGRIREAIPEARFVLVGRGPLEDRVRRQAEEMGLNGTVVFAGFRTDVPRVAASFDVFALPSLYEGLSIALLEVMALGKPVVVTSVGGSPEVVSDGVDGLLVPPRDSEALATGILSVLRDAGLRRRLGESARRRVADFDIRHAVRRTEQVYGELLP
jgi:glycosyltransferase involved in cell wall biosynthesis